MGYPRLEKLLKAEIEARKKDYRKILSINPSFLAENLTPTQWKNYSNGNLSKKEAFALAGNKIDKKLDADFAKKKARLDEISNTPRISSIYGDQSTYGRTKLAIYDEKNKEFNANSFAGGGGYDRASTSLANALQSNDGFMRVFYDYAEANAPKRKGNWENVFGYTGATKNALPYIDGGTGEYTIKRVLELIGFDSPDISGKRWSIYYREPAKPVKVKSFTSTKMPNNSMLNKRAFK